jgi:transposase-like protein
MRDLLLEWIRLERFGTQRPPCLRCRHGITQRWGSYRGRRRYRCARCRATFSDLTGTALWRCKRLDRWPGVSHAMEESHSVRRTARDCGIAPSTAFRWRHQLLSRSTQIRLEGIRPGTSVVTRLLALPESAKGDPSRGPLGVLPPRGLTASPFRGFPNRVWTLATIVRARRPRAASLQFEPVFIAPRPPPSAALVRGLSPLLRAGGAVYGETGHLSPMASACRTLHGRWNPVPRGTGEVGRIDADLRSVRRHTLALRHWMRRFRGVATHHLHKYLTWYVLVRRHSGQTARVAEILGDRRRRGNAVPAGTRE